MSKVNPVGSGEAVQQILIIEGGFYLKEVGTAVYHKIALVEDPLNPGYYLLQDTGQSANTPDLG